MAADAYPTTSQASATEGPYASEVSNLNAGEKDLAARVKDLESALKKMKDKEDADKKKAASAPSVRPYGRLQVDWAAFSQNANSITQAGDMLNGTEFRRARIGLQGDAFQVLDYRIEMDFSGQTAFKDVYITYKELPWLGNVRAGHFYENFGMEVETSDNYLSFMERSLISASGGLGGLGDRKTGVMAFNWSEDERMTWSVGAFAWQVRENPPTFPTGNFDDNGGTAFDLRLTYLPWFDEATEGRGVLHTGISYSYRDVATLINPAAGGRYSIAQLPEAHLAKNMVNTGALDDTARINALSPELAVIYGPFVFQSEYLWMWLQRTAHAAPTFDGGYAYVGYFLTGENPGYDRHRGLFDRLRPFENFFRVRDEDGNVQMGKGAWEVLYRVSYLNLTDTGVFGGRVVDHTIGLTWFLNPYTKVFFNYVHSETSDRNTNPSGVPQGGVFPRGIADIVETRCQIDF